MAELPNETALNGICPYFTMFPLGFPYEILRERAQPGDAVLDPFCGRGTTNYASRLLRLPSYGIDSNPVAVAIARAKLANTTPRRIVQAAARILREVTEPVDVPEGAFWEWAFHPEVLRTLCRLREGLLRNCRSDARVALRALLLGALHGPRPKGRPSYFSNQCQRTYAPKPNYAVGWWQRRGVRPERVDVLALIEERAVRYYGPKQPHGTGRVIQGDSRDQSTYRRLAPDRPVRWVITSPPFYGMRTYLPDQWLRYWFLGGPPTVVYHGPGQISHASVGHYTDQLRTVWRFVTEICAPDARLVIRFGAIRDRQVSPLEIVHESLVDSGWTVEATCPAGSASRGKRQALHFGRTIERPLEEYDVWAIRTRTDVFH